jgi:hypothetical protein
VRTEQIADTWGLNGVMTLLQESERHHVSIKLPCGGLCVSPYRD